MESAPTRTKLILTLAAGAAVGAAVATACLRGAFSPPKAPQPTVAAVWTRDRRSRLRKRTGDAPLVVGCSTQNNYFTAIDRILTPDDSVIVIRGSTKQGAINGSARAEAATSRSDNVDVADKAKSRVVVYEGDAWDATALQALSDQAAAGPFNIICLEPTNMFGNDMLTDNIALIRMLRRVLPGLRAVLVKSKQMSLHGRLLCDSRQVLAMTPAAREAEFHQTKGHTTVIAAIGVSDYRDTIPIVVRPGDTVLEIGMAFGTTCFPIAEAAGAAGHVVGVDIGKVCVARARKEAAKMSGHSARVQFELADGWDMPALQRLGQFHAIYVDVGGLSGADGEFEALALVRMLACTFAPTLRFVVIKSRCLRHHASEFTYVGALPTNTVLPPAQASVGPSPAAEEEADDGDREGKEAAAAARKTLAHTNN